MDQKLCKNFIHGGGGRRAGIKQIVFLFRELQQFMYPPLDLAPMVRPFTPLGALPLVKNPTLIGQRPCKLSLGGPCSTEVYNVVVDRVYMYYGV